MERVDVQYMRDWETKQRVPDVRKPLSSNYCTCLDQRLIAVPYGRVPVLYPQDIAVDARLMMKRGVPS